jgi:hypothetical protein
MTRARIALLALAASVLALAAGASSASAQTHHEENDSSGAVQATLSFDKRSEFAYTNVRLRIVRGGATAFDGPVTEPCEDCGVAPAGRGEDDSMRVLDLNGDGEPEVVVDLYTGGAHCCTIALVYGFSPGSGTYERAVENFLDAGYVLEDMNGDGVPEFKSFDARFASLFLPYAGSVLPVRIFNYGPGGVVDTTRSFPDHIRAHARSLRRLYDRMRRRRGGDVRSVLAAYVAEKYLLGEGAAGYALALRAYRRGELRGFGRHDAYPRNRQYLRLLRGSLRRYGYR